MSVVDTVTIGRAPGNTIQLEEPGVSRHHARIVVEGDVPEIEDVGSSYGTYLDDRRLTDRAPLRDGARIELGDAKLRVEARRREAESGRTIVVPPGTSLVIPAVGAGEIAPVTDGVGPHPRVRSGWALKRLEEEEGDRRYVLKDLRRGTFVRMSPEDAELFELVDGESSVHELVAEANRRLGPGGAARLGALLADLGERGLIEGIDRTEPAVTTGWLRRALRPRTRLVPGAGQAFETIYRRGGFVLFTTPALTVLASVALAGAVAFADLLVTGQVTPFVVASRVGLGGLAFLLGRFLVVAFHELAHGLTVASFGRRVPRAGFKLVLIFPYAFVDTSDAWFEPRRRRLAISGAGPASDLVVGGAAALVALLLSSGSLREVVFQLSLGAYIGAFYNLNPMLERDGYHLLVDLLRQPGLRRRSRRWLAGIFTPRHDALGEGDGSLSASMRRRPSAGPSSRPCSPS